MTHAAAIGRDDAQALDDVVARALGAVVAESSVDVPLVHVEHDGRIISVVDGVLRLTGLEHTALGDLIEVGSVRALVVELHESEAIAALLADAETISEMDARQPARRRAETLSVVVGEASLGRVVDALGRPVDGRAPVVGGRRMPLERAAPQIFERSHVHTPLYTGILAIDGMFPIGRGQRELIAGDEGTGRTALAVDAMLNQRHSDVVCVYAGVGQRRAETWRIKELLHGQGVDFVIVSAPEDASPAMRYLAPYTATAIAEYFRDRGQHALVVYDDLSAHAVAWRELSLLLGRPPGREAYPGDVFYLHSRLLERSAQLCDDLGGGSLTALPICSLESGRLTAYIPTNLVSITDGQLVMSASAFASGERPAIDAGLSVSRVGARAQSALFSGFSRQLKLDYAAFLELEAFSRLGTRLEPEARRRVELGRRVRALLRARQGAPLALLAELVRLCLARQPDLILPVDLDDVESYASTLTTLLDKAHPTLAEDVGRGATTNEQFTQLVLQHAKKVAHG